MQRQLGFVFAIVFQIIGIDPQHAGDLVDVF